VCGFAAPSQLLRSLAGHTWAAQALCLVTWRREQACISRSPATAPPRAGSSCQGTVKSLFFSRRRCTRAAAVFFASFAVAAALGPQLLSLAHNEVRWPAAAAPPPSTRSPTNPRPRFGQQLKQSLNKEWLFYYIDYEGLKTALRVHHTWDEKSEQNFVEQLEKELDKVYTFVRVKSDEIIRRIAASDKEVNEAVARSQRQQQHDTTQGDDAFDEDFDLLEEDLSDIIADVHDLAKFTQLNYTGFQKIIKKHDVRSPPCCPRPMLTRRRKTRAGCSSPSSPPA
jgi:hypothetical protein